MSDVWREHVLVRIDGPLTHQQLGVAHADALRVRASILRKHADL